MRPPAAHASAPAIAAPGRAREPWVLGWLRGGLGAGAVPVDVLAGLTAAAVVIPKAMAYATVAGLPVQVGLYVAFIPPIVYAVLGGSRVLSVSTTTTIAILAATALGEAVPGTEPARLAAAAATLAVLVGAILIAAAVLRLGFLANFISEPVLAGFKAGIGLVIIVDQAPKLLGIHVQKVGFFRDLFHVAAGARHASVSTLLVAAGTVAVLLGLKRWAPRLPAALLAVLVGIGASALLGLDALGVKTVGAIPGGLPGLVRPDLALVAALWPAALAIALMSFTESIASGRAFSRGGEPRPAPNQELLATGLGNVLGGLLGAMPSGGGTTQTLVNRRAGARTQLAGLTAGVAALIVLLLLAPAVAFMPQATLAAIVVIYSLDLLDLSDFRQILAVRRTEFVWALIAFAGVLLLGTLRGIVVAVVASIVSLAHQASNPPVYEVGRKPGTNVFRRRTEEHPEDEVFPGLVLLRVEGRIFFGNAERVLDRMVPLVQAANPLVIVLDCSAILDLEYSALKMLESAEQRVRDRGVQLWLSALNPAARRVVERAPLGKTLGRERMCFNLEQAVQRFQALRAAG